jgi:protein involved in polysaccharide export with SLBB domain
VLTYVIRVDDVLQINVWKEPEVSRTVPVRSDGKISVPLAGEVQASGETPCQLEKELATKLQSFISEPEVTVVVTEVRIRNPTVSVKSPRPYRVRPRTLPLCSPGRRRRIRICL